MKKVLKWTGIVLAGMLLILFIAGWLMDEPIPEGQSGPEADELAEKMLAAVDKAAWDTTTYVQWTFKGLHDFFWDKERHLCKVNWGNTEVLIDLNTLEGKAFKDGVEQEGDDADKLLKKAWAFFANDSFWLNAVVKAFDPGTVRKKVQLKDGRLGLLVQYTSGGVTPGDSYLWILDDNYRPVAWKMWVSIIPVGGVGSTWEDWISLPTGAQVATSHKLGPLNLSLDVQAGNDLEDFSMSTDPFSVLYQ